MNNDTIIEGRELIKNFMQLELSKGVLGDSRIYYKVQLTTHEIISAEDDFMYHLSFDWLMPVVEKISKTIIKGHPPFNSDQKVRVEIVPNGYVINALYKSVLQFIQWYNTQTKPHQ